MISNWRIGNIDGSSGPYIWKPCSFSRSGGGSQEDAAGGGVKLVGPGAAASVVAKRTLARARGAAA